MDNPIQSIPLANLALSFLPVAVVIVLMYRWALGGGTALWSNVRMLVQLLAIGYVLTYIFRAEQPWIVLAVLAVMLTVSSWITLRPVQPRPPGLYWKILAAISLGGVSTLALITGLVLDPDPWFAPHLVIPLAGMIFANSMNTVSVAAERFASERVTEGYEEARRRAMNAAMIPVINSMFAVGLVSLPGMMTGQILSGVSPLIAVRYQGVVMALIFGSAGLSAACYRWLLRDASATPSEA
ncbi:MAG: ABC transporter permease [Xanthomonadales bacterium]|nr:ABC transporter permease [Xanthomonadales bacterium]